MPDHPDPRRGQPPGPPSPPPRWQPSRPFPAYRHTPGLTPHPIHDPDGHSHGRPDVPPELLPPERWRESGDYLYAIDLYNNGYWWECHEVLEGLWIAAGRTSTQAQVYQAIIQAAAANLKWHLQNPSAARYLTEEVAKKLERVQERLQEAGAPASRYLGVDVAGFVDALRAFHVRGGSERPSAYPPLLILG